MAWVAERKDVLSTAFGLLAIWQYARYVERPAKSAYGLMLLFFALGLTAKPMLVTLPFVLLLLDVWPLGRWPHDAFISAPAFLATAGRRVAEKWPLFLLTALSCVVTFLVQRASGAVSTLDYFPLPARLGNALVAYTWYVEKTFWPTDLCVIHPLERWSNWRLAAAIVLLVAGSGCAVRLLRRHPWLFVGWFWFLGTLVPVIGLVQVGGQAWAERYTYVPAIGLFIVLAWGAAVMLSELWHRRVAAAVASLALCGAVMASALQLQYWRDSASLMGRAVQVTRNNVVAHTNYGYALMGLGRAKEAEPHFAAALRVNPRHTQAWNGLGNVQSLLNKYAEAVGHYEAALNIDPNFVPARVGLGTAFIHLGKTNEAVIQYQEALRVAPDNQAALNNLGLLHLALKRADRAADYHRKALEFNPANATTCLLLGDALAQLGQAEAAAGSYQRFAHLRRASAPDLIQAGVKLAGLGKLEAAIACYQQALAMRPNQAAAHYNLANALARLGRKEESLPHYAQALKTQPDDVQARLNLGMVLSDLGKFEPAIEHYEAVLKLQPDHPKAHAACGFAMVKTGRFAPAAAHFAEALRLQPDWVAVMDHWARLRATYPDDALRNAREAVRLAERASELTGHKSPAILDTLAAAYAEAGRFPDAVRTARKARQLAGDAKLEQLTADLEARIRLYEAGKPYRERL